MQKQLDTSFRPLSRGLFFNDFPDLETNEEKKVFVPFLGDFFSIVIHYDFCTAKYRVFVPFLGDFFSIRSTKQIIIAGLAVFVPFLGDFFSIACLRSPDPSALASAFAAGMRESLHQALSFGDEMPIFPVRAGIGGDLS